MGVLIDSVKVLLAVGIPERVNPEVSFGIFATNHPLFSFFSLLHTVQSVVYLLLRQLLLIPFPTLKTQEVLRVLVVVNDELG